MLTVEVDRVETFFERYGSGHSIVFVHGSGWDHRQWAPQFKHLSEDYEIVAYDYRGHGRTAGSDEEELTAAILADDPRRFIENLDLVRPTAVGCSLGGRIAYAFAARNPDSLSALVTLEASPVDPDQGTFVGSLVKKAWRKLDLVVGAERTYRFMLAVESFTADDDPMEQVVDGLGISLKEYLLTAHSKADETEMRKLSAAHSQEIEVSRITVPSLILTGENPRDSFVRAAETLVAEIPSATHETVPEGGHGANMDNPEAFNQLLRGFLAGVAVN